MIIICPFTGKQYERTNVAAFHSDDCPYCKREDDGKAKA